MSFSKIIIIGEYAVGKTTLLRTYKDSKFFENPLPTQGVDSYHIKRDGSDISARVILFPF